MLGGYTSGVEDFDTFSIDRIGDFRANGAAAGVRYDLPTLTSLKGVYEYQWRDRGVNMGRVIVSFAQRFCGLVDRPNELYSGHAILREGSASPQRMGVAVLL